MARKVLELSISQHINNSLRDVAVDHRETHARQMDAVDLLKERVIKHREVEAIEPLQYVVRNAEPNVSHEAHDTLRQIAKDDRKDSREVRDAAVKALEEIDMGATILPIARSLRRAN